MKATIEIPNDLYRRVKAKSAMQSRTVREVTVSLYLGWVEQQATIVEAAPPYDSAPPSWFAAAKSYANKVNNHDMTSIKNSISVGRKSEKNAI